MRTMYHGIKKDNTRSCWVHSFPMWIVAEWRGLKLIFPQSSLVQKGNDLSKLNLVDFVLLLITFEVLFLGKYSVHIIKLNDPVRTYISDVFIVKGLELCLRSDAGLIFICLVMTAVTT
jgi:hypothetical protein